jgi:hypothetical protein
MNCTLGTTTENNVIVIKQKRVMILIFFFMIDTDSNRGQVVKKLHNP